MNVTNLNEEARERQVLDMCLRELGSLRTAAPSFYMQLDDTDPDICTRAELVDLMHAAPTASARQYLFGKFTMRIAIGLATGRPF